ncbi:MAG: NAD(P)H-dependent oxidoreductase [Chloroflexales bacterium]|nr:NAD(P)H-dependent oxidoreductase [Chloroflexales bacterium]
MTSSSTSPSLRILGIGGSTRAGSRSLFVLNTALAVAAAGGAHSVLADVRALDLPIYNEEWRVEDYPARLAWLLDEVRVADAFLLCSPTYHGTLSGVVKNVLDALNYLEGDTPRFLGGKVVGLIGVGGGAANVINSLGHATRALNGLAAPTVVAVPSDAVDMQAGTLAAPVQRRLDALVTQVLDLSHRLRMPV